MHSLPHWNSRAHDCWVVCSLFFFWTCCLPRSPRGSAPSGEWGKHRLPSASPLHAALPGPSNPPSPLHHRDGGRACCTTCEKCTRLLSSRETRAGGFRRCKSTAAHLNTDVNPFSDSPSSPAPFKVRRAAGSPRCACRSRARKHHVTLRTHTYTTPTHARDGCGVVKRVVGRVGGMGGHTRVQAAVDLDARGAVGVCCGEVLAPAAAATCVDSRSLHCVCRCPKVRRSP